MAEALPRPAAAGDLAAILRLNQAHLRETSALDEAALGKLLHGAFAALVADGGLGEDALSGFVIALDQDASYDSPNFRYFADRCARFVYVDRVIVADGARGRGVARRLYNGVIARMRQAGHRRLVCEVNIDPPNPGSDAFHAALGFAQIGQARLADRGKTVRYLAKDIG